MNNEHITRGNDLALVEAALFLAPAPLTRRALAKILGGVQLAYVDGLLEDLTPHYEATERGIELCIEDGRAMLRVKAAYVEQVAHLAPQQDIPRPALRTLAIIAYNHPMTQADLVKVRGNKAYKHVQDLIERRLIRAEEHGRTKLLHVTGEFLRYFGLRSVEEFRFHVSADLGESQDGGDVGESPESGEFGESPGSGDVGEPQKAGDLGGSTDSVELGEQHPSDAPGAPAETEGFDGSSDANGADAEEGPEVSDGSHGPDVDDRVDEPAPSERSENGSGPPGWPTEDASDETAPEPEDQTSGESEDETDDQVWKRDLEDTATAGGE